MAQGYQLSWIEFRDYVPSVTLRKFIRDLLKLGAWKIVYNIQPV